MEGEESPDWAVIEADGELDLSSAPRLRARMVDAVERHGPHLVVDLRAAVLIDSAGLGVLAGLLRRTAARGGALRVVTAPGLVRDVLRATGLVKVMGEYDSVADATRGGLGGPA